MKQGYWILSHIGHGEWYDSNLSTLPDCPGGSWNKSRTVTSSAQRTDVTLTSHTLTAGLSTWVFYFSGQLLKKSPTDNICMDKLDHIERIFFFFYGHWKKVPYFLLTVQLFTDSWQPCLTVGGTVTVIRGIEATWLWWGHYGYEGGSVAEMGSLWLHCMYCGYDRGIIGRKHCHRVVCTVIWV